MELDLLYQIYLDGHGTEFDGGGIPGEGLLDAEVVVLFEVVLARSLQHDEILLFVAVVGRAGGATVVAVGDLGMLFNSRVEGLEECLLVLVERFVLRLGLGDTNSVLL